MQPNFIYFPICNNKRLCLFVFLSAFACITYAQADKLQFRNLSTNNGLSYSRVTCFSQDIKGRMWIGTSDGLNLYNGVNFEVFKADTGKFGPSSREINDIKTDNKGNLWIAGNMGIDVYSPENGLFVNHNQLLKKNQGITNESVSRLLFETNEKIWAGTVRGLFSIDIKNSRSVFYSVVPDHPDSLNFAVIEIFIDKYNNLWLGTEGGGLNRFDRQGQKFVKYNKLKNEKTKITGNSVRSIFQDSDGDLWLGTDFGLQRFDYATNTLVQYGYKPGNPKGPLKGMVRSIFEDSQKRLWVGFQYGLTIYNKQKDEFTYVVNDFANPKSIAGDEIWAIAQDKAGNLWFGTYNNGLSICSSAPSPFRAYRNDPKNPNSLAGNSVLAFCEDSLSNVWIGTDHAGMDYFNRKTQNFRHFRNNPRNPNSLSSDAVLSIDAARDGSLWIGTWGGGLNHFDPRTGNFSHYLPDARKPGSINGLHIWKAMEDKNGKIWVASQQEGLGLFDREKGMFRAFTFNPSDKNSISHNSVLCLIEDSGNTLWVGTAFGLNKLNTRNFTFERFLVTFENNLVSDGHFINDIYKDKRGILWVATSQGLVEFDPKSNDTTNYADLKELRTANVVGIVGHGDSIIWASSANRGLSAINIYTREVENFGLNEGLPSISFNRRARTRLQDGTFMFGTSEGMLVFHPDSIKKLEPSYRVIFTDFLLFNEKMSPGLPGSPLTKHISFTDTIRLKHNQSVFTIYFSALEYISPGKVNYAYKLEGFDGKWNFVGRKHDATYTNLKPGSYTLRVSTYGNIAQPGKNESALTIIIVPPFWKTTWFSVLLAITIIGILFAVYFLRLRSINRMNLQLKEMVSQRTSEIEEKNKRLLEKTEELNKTNVLLEERHNKIEEQSEILKCQRDELSEVISVKDKLFSIIAHDLRNPFNSLMGFADIISGSYETLDDEKRLYYIKMIQNASQSVFDLLNNLLNWSRAQSGRMKLEPASTNLNFLVQRNITLMKNSADKKQIDLGFYTSKDPMVAEIDENMIDIVVRNLLSNAIKFTPNSGHVNATTTSGADTVTIEVSDTGTGIGPSDIEKLFRTEVHFSNPGTQNEKGTGIGLIVCKEFVDLHKGRIWVESTLGKGTTFFVSLPLRHVPQ
ncbi:MAG: hypothetical protein JXB34_14150 [Bacteroidales bacterium]|nr:hypothetical protein [Bacteroidales bacterium]